jgi:type II secretory pathway component PulF
MVWRWRAVDGMACELTGLEWGSRAEARARLEAQGLLITSLEPDIGCWLKDLLAGASLPPEKLALFFKDFAGMLSAGLAIDHILSTFKESLLDAGMGASCRRISQELAGGKSLAEAMAAVHVFPPIALNAVRAGEHAGELVEVMGLLSEYFNLIAELKGKCLRALAYPACVFFFLLAALIYVSQAVIPQLAPLLPPEALNDPVTRLMLGFSAMLRGGWPLLAGVVPGLVLAVGIFVHHKSGVWDDFLAHIPLIGTIRKDLAISLYFFDLYILLKSGIPLDAAMAEVERSARGVMARHMQHCRQALSDGETLSASLKEAEYFPPLVIETMRLGEATGRYEEHCERIFRTYYRFFEARVQMAVAVVQPLLLAVCALFILAMAMAFLKPVYANLTHIGIFNP